MSGGRGDGPGRPPAKHPPFPSPVKPSALEVLTADYQRLCAELRQAEDGCAEMRDQLVEREKAAHQLRFAVNQRRLEMQAEIDKLAGMPLGEVLQDQTGPVAILKAPPPGLELIQDNHASSSQSQGSVNATEPRLEEGEHAPAGLSVPLQGVEDIPLDLGGLDWEYGPKDQMLHRSCGGTIELLGGEMRCLRCLQQAPWEV
jgi:hypothetical protein